MFWYHHTVILSVHITGLLYRWKVWNCITDDILQWIILNLNDHEMITNHPSGETSYRFSMLSLAPKPSALLSSGFHVLSVSRVNTRVVTRAFSIGVPTFWNSLPGHVMSSNSIVCFRHHFKPHLFRLAYLYIRWFVDDIVRHTLTMRLPTKTPTIGCLPKIIDKEMWLLTQITCYTLISL